MDKNNREFLEFMGQGEKPPKALMEMTSRDIQLSFQKQSILARLLSAMTLGGFATLLFCPQFGIGLPEGHGITHTFRLIGDWACATFCGFLFLAFGVLFSNLIMKGEEIWWVWRRYKHPLVLLPTFLWASLMLTNISLSKEGETILYHIVWLASAVVTLGLGLSVRSWLFTRNTRQLFN